MSEIRRVMLRRSRNAVITIFGIMVLNFIIIRGMGDPALLLTPKDPKADQDLVEANKIRFGLDKPVFTCVKSIYPVTNISFDCAGDPFDNQFFIYLRNTVTGDWGTSYVTREPVISIVARDMGWTLVLVGTSTIFTIMLGMVIGAFSAQRRGRAFDVVSTGFGLFFYGMPIFWLGLVLQLLFSRQQFGLNWWPVLPHSQEYDHDLGTFAWQADFVLSALQHLFLPALTLALGTFAGISLVMRNSLVDVMTEDYVVTARAKGLAERMILRRHVLPNGLPPMVTLIALDMAFIFGGAYQVEVVFSYEGIGFRTINSIFNLDFPLLQFIIVIGGVAVVLANFFADLILVKIDPRIKIA